MANPVLSIRVEAPPGCSLYDACFEAWEMAKMLGVVVVFEFNGDDVVVRPVDERSTIAAVNWWKSRMERKTNG